MWLNLNRDWLVAACSEVTCVWSPGRTNEKPAQVCSGSSLTLFGLLSGEVRCVKGCHGLGLSQGEDLSVGSGWCDQQAGQAVGPPPTQPWTTFMWLHTMSRVLIGGSSRTGSVLVCLSARAQRGFTGTKERAHLSCTQSQPGPPPADDGRQRVGAGRCWTGRESQQGRRGAMGLLLRGHMSEQQSYLHPTNLEVFSTLKEEFHFVKCRSLFNVTRSKFILLALIYNWQFSISIWA